MEVYAPKVAFGVIIVGIREIFMDHREEKKKRMLALFLRNKKRNQIDLTFSEMEIIKEENEEKLCSICLCEEEFRDEAIVKLPCSHIYHKTCITEWLMKKQVCPMCRTKITLKES